MNTLSNKVQLITYPDSLGGDLKQLHQVVDTHFKGSFPGGIHILPPFPSSGDRGFAPLTYLEIEPEFGEWSDVETLGQDHPILLDLMVNHISQQSPFFQDVLQKGADSEWSDLFLTPDKIWKDGVIPDEDLSQIFLRRDEPYSDFTIESTGEKMRVWTTFGKTTPSEQIDLDVKAAKTRELFEQFFENFAKHAVKIVRLDAIGYVIKKPSTNCFFVKPEIFEFLNWVRGIAEKYDIELLPEVHSHYSIQYELSEAGFWIYDFILPYRILEALLNKSSLELNQYLKERPEKQFTMLDCHDGIPVKPDLDDLVSTHAAQSVVDACVSKGANLSKVYSKSHCSADGFDVHQIRCSFYSMLDHDDDAYIAARAIQLFAPGIPQIYYVGLLAGENDMEMVKQTGEGREINRHNYTLKEIEEACDRDVVKRLKRLIELRNDHPAFNGQFQVIEDDRYDVHMRWEIDSSFVALKIAFDSMESFVFSSDSASQITRIQL